MSQSTNSGTWVATRSCKRSLMVAFGDGTADLAGVRMIVERFKSDIEYWEPRNEPNFGSGAADFVNKELKPFYETVHGVDPNLKVLGPGTVAIGPQLQPWLEDFFKAGARSTSMRFIPFL